MFRIEQPWLQSQSSEAVWKLRLPSWPVSAGPYGLCGRKAALNLSCSIAKHYGCCDVCCYLFNFDLLSSFFGAWCPYKLGWYPLFGSNCKHLLKLIIGKKKKKQVTSAWVQVTVFWAASRCPLLVKNKLWSTGRHIFVVSRRAVISTFVRIHNKDNTQSSGAVWKSRWTTWAPCP